MSTTTLWYFADPMCSWCWGFSPVIDAIKASYGEQLNMALMLGGLRPGMTEPMTSSLREEILHHWREVHKMTGQEFTFDGALPENFVYDTEPACRAVVTLAMLNPDGTFNYFKAIQKAFYIEQRDVTQIQTLADLAVQHGMMREQFIAQFDSNEARETTQLHFNGTRQAGVSGFPSLVLQKESQYQFVAKGYRPLQELAPLIEAWLGQD